LVGGDDLEGSGHDVILCAINVAHLDAGPAALTPVRIEGYFLCAVCVQMGDTGDTPWSGGADSALHSNTTTGKVHYAGMGVSGRPGGVLNGGAPGCNIS
jgi:hypothetical protein